MTTPSLMQQFEALSDEQKIEFGRRLLHTFDSGLLIENAIYKPNDDRVFHLVSRITCDHFKDFSPAPALSTDDKPLTGKDAGGVGD